MRWLTNKPANKVLLMLLLFVTSFVFDFDEIKHKQAKEPSVWIDWTRMNFFVVKQQIEFVL